MLSPLIQKMYASAPLELERYSDLHIMQSAAGYYVGSTYADPQFPGFPMPGSRDSEYFGDPARADFELKQIELGNRPTRMTL